MEPCYVSIKYLLLIFNSIFVAGGLTILILGSIVQWNLDFYYALFGAEFAAPSILLITIGSVIFLISFFGCFGAFKESNCLLYTYAAILTMILIGLLSATTIAFVTAWYSEEGFRELFEEFLYHYHGAGEQGAAATEAWDTMQPSFECCGMDSSEDWLSLYPSSIPASCQCDVTLGSQYCGQDGLFNKGCYNIVVQYFVLSQFLLASTALVFSLLSVTGIALSCTLASALNSNKRWQRLRQ